MDTATAERIALADDWQRRQLARLDVAAVLLSVAGVDPTTADAAAVATAWTVAGGQSAPPETEARPA